MENNAGQELDVPLVHPEAQSSVDAEYQTSTTTPRSVSPRSLVGSIFDDDDETKATNMTSSRDEADVAAGSRLPQEVDSQMSTFVLAAILFFNAGGGPFGVEPSLKAAGNLYAIIGFAAMPFIWALPESIMTYELASMYPCASGGVRWVEEAFGEGWGLLAGYLGWTAGISNSATYPVLFLAYVEKQFLPQLSDTEQNIFLHYGILAGITLVLALVNYRGLDVVGKTTVLIFFICMAPFVLMVIIGIPKVDPSKWLQTPTGEDEVFDDDALTSTGWFPEANLAGIAFRPFINNLYWNFNGFDAGGHFSQVTTKKTLWNGIMASLLLVSSSYLFPIMISMGATDIEQDDWREGSFAVAGTEIGGRWLGNWVVVGAGVSLLAQFFSGMSAESLQVQGMADRGQLPSLCRSRSRYNTPVFGLLTSVMVILILLPLKFSILVELSNFAFCIQVLLEFCAFVQLRIRMGDCSKLRKVVYMLLMIGPMLFNIAVILLASYATYIFGACVAVFGVFVIYARKIECSFCCRVRD